MKSLSDGTVTGSYRSAASHHNEFHKLTNADVLSANPDQNKTDEQTMTFRIVYRCILKCHKGKTIWFGQYDVENGNLSLDLVLLLVCTGM